MEGERRSEHVPTADDLAALAPITSCVWRPLKRLYPVIAFHPFYLLGFILLNIKGRRKSVTLLIKCMGGSGEAFDFAACARWRCFCAGAGSCGADAESCWCRQKGLSGHPAGRHHPTPRRPDRRDLRLKLEAA